MTKIFSFLSVFAAFQAILSLPLNEPDALYANELQYRFRLRSAQPSSETNLREPLAESKSHSIPPLLHDPPRRTRKTTFVSSIPTWSSTGYIAIYERHGLQRLVGYVDGHKVIHTKETAPRYTYRAYGYGGDVYDSNKDEKMCITAGFFGQSLRPGLKNFHLARTTQIIAYPGNTLTFDTNTGTYIETNVFFLDPLTYELSAEWTNSDGSHPMTYIFVHDERIYYTGDIHAVQQSLYIDMTRVVFKWIETNS
ncbi:hypothetical protein DFS33DRAFT_1332683 [Desarmillaria ectypa]|nr:hypothetical protein DFS33DRAFT_1332683 [Desarmillaria ectypa]